MPDTLFLRESRFDTAFVQGTYDKMKTRLQIEFDSIIRIGFLRAQSDASSIEGYFDLELVSDSGEYGICPCYDLIPNGVWINFRPDSANYWLSYYADDQANGLSLWVRDGVTRDSGYYSKNKHVGTWIHPGNNGAKEVGQYDSAGRLIIRTLYWSYNSPKIKMTSTSEFGGFMIFKDSLEGEVYFEEKNVTTMYDSNGVIRSKHIFYLSNTNGFYHEYFARYSVKGNLVIEAVTVDGITKVEGRFPNGSTKSIEYYGEFNVFEDVIYGTKVGNHTFYKIDGSLDHIEIYDH